MRQQISIFLFLILLVFACTDIDEVTVTQETPQPDVFENYDPVIRNVSASVLGFIVDENDDPVSGADIKLGAFNTSTDEFGHFFFDNVNINARGSIVQVEKSGYFDGSRRFFPVENTDNRVKIQLIRKDFNQSFTAENGGTVNVDGGASIVFDSDAIKTADGSPYNGEVFVAAEWLNPLELSTLDRMPGNLQGVDLLNQEVALRTYGMLAVELEGAGGQSLNIADNRTATISMPVPFQLQASAPTEIELWSYSEAFGLWGQEGTATLIDGNYVGTVSHFSFWNCDVPFDLIEFDATLINSDEEPMVGATVGISFASDSSWTAYGYTDQNGVVSGLIPADESLLLSVFDICGNIIFSQAIGPFSSSTSLGTIEVSGISVNNTSVSGNLLDCNMNTVDDGLVLIEFDGQTIYHYTEGEPFDISFATCGNSSFVTVTGVDLNGLTQSGPISASSNIDNNLGEINVCDQVIEDFLEITVDGTTAIYVDVSIFSDSLGGTTISNATGNQEQYFWITFIGEDIGDYSSPQEHFIEIIFDSILGWSLQGSFDSFNVTQYGDIGEPVIGNFSGTLTNFTASSSEEVSVSGNFSITR